MTQFINAFLHFPKQVIAQPEQAEDFDDDEKRCREIRLHRVLQDYRLRLFHGMTGKLRKVAAEKGRRGDRPGPGQRPIGNIRGEERDRNRI